MREVIMRLTTKPFDEKNAYAEIIQELVRCRDCKYGAQDEIGRWLCVNFSCQVGDKDGSGFCADGERRKE